MQQRSDWGAVPPEAPLIPWNVANLDGFTFHWFGSPRAAKTHEGCDDLLRSVQRSHQAGEYIDIAYNISVCPHGEEYELRGFHRKSGANGTTDANNRFLSIVYMAGIGDPLTEDGKRALRRVAQKAIKLGVKPSAHLHKEFVSTGCPGPAVEAWVKAGGWKVPKVERWNVNFPTGQKDKDGNWVRDDMSTAHLSTWFARHPGAAQRGTIHVRPVRED